MKQYLTKFFLTDLISLAPILMVAFFDKQTFCSWIIKDIYRIQSNKADKHGSEIAHQHFPHLEADESQLIYGFDKYRIYKFFRGIYIIRFANLTRYIKGLRLIL